MGLSLSVSMSARAAGTSGPAIEASSFCKSLVPGKYILPAKEGWWNWGMAPIYDESGKLHIFNSSIPYMRKKGMGYWPTKSIINHYVADSIEGPFELVSTAFSSETATYHNPQISKVGDTYVLVFLSKPATNDSLQSIGMATAKSLYGPWTENPNNPIIKPVAGTSNAAHASNPTFLVDREGKFRIYYKSMSEGSRLREISLAIADAIEGPYIDVPDNPLISFRHLGRDIEDPYAFFYEDRYYMILEDRMDVAGALSGDSVPLKETKNGGLRPGFCLSQAMAFTGKGLNSAMIRMPRISEWNFRAVNALIFSGKMESLNICSWRITAAKQLDSI
ncbi:MAG: glycoside hydrolase family protein [Opitutae bacterium]|nr:glycoside hydrolase family protein [Opitutae bacterium]